MRLSSVWIVLGILALAGCGQDREDAVEKGEAADPALARKAAEATVRKFSRDLKRELMAALTDGGPAAAIEVCRERAPEVAAAHSTEGILTIRRVASRNRNPGNAPSGDEAVVLARFETAAGEAPGFVEEWRDGEQGKAYLYYEPIYTGALCLKCHGEADRLAPEISGALAEHYPEDRATGFAGGDLRGMFAVEIAWPAGASIARELAGEESTSKRGSQ